MDARSRAPGKEACEVLDPVAAYDRIAPIYGRLMDQREPYLRAVERIIIAEIPAHSRSLLDVGAGDGVRTARLASAARLKDVTLVEPSAAFRRRCTLCASVWAMRAEDLRHQEGSFDVIVCLWNVLGHILPAAARTEVVRDFVRLVSAQGRVFIDVQHRYNARHYGVPATALRFLRDRISPSPTNGDVKVTWDIDGEICTTTNEPRKTGRPAPPFLQRLLPHPGDAGNAPLCTTGHVFTHTEFAALARGAGLRIAKRFVIDYASGELRRSSLQGHLLYVLRR